MDAKCKTVTAYSVSHFAVDFACAFLVLRFFGNRADTAMLCLIYNFFAFAMQLPMGIMADKLNRNSLVALCGCIFVSVSYLTLCVFPPILVCTMLGVGNGLFHIGGGIDVLNLSGNKSALLGVFVSPGALGLYLGKLAGASGSFSAAIAPIGVLFCGILCILVCGTEKSDNPAPSFDGVGKNGVLAVTCFFLVVLIRTYMGLTMDFPWKASYPIILTLAVVLGKTAGGFIGDALGFKRAAVITLVPSAVLFFFSENPFCGILAVFLFNMTMPMTLFASYEIFRQSGGFAFGLLTFSMYLGLLPVYYGLICTGSASYILFTAASLFILLFGLGREDKK